jgi:chromosome segregation ATPase
MNIRIEEKLILEALYENDYPLSTTELRSSTKIGTQAIGYSVRDKLAENNLIEFWYEERQGTDTRIHELTDHGIAEIERGLIGNIFDEEKQDLEKVALEARIDELEERLESIENKTDANKQLLDTLSNRIEKVADLVKKHDARINGIRWALEESDVSFGVVEYVKKVKNGE